MILIFEGPEKSGKTTTIKAVETALIGRGRKVRIRKFTGPMTSEAQYLEPLLEDVRDPDTVVLWDRGWVSEYVYSSYFKRTSTLRDNSRRAEDVFTSIVDKYGLKYVLIPVDTRELERRHDDATDLDIPPSLECFMFMDYAETYGWTMVFNKYTDDSLSINVLMIVNDVDRLEATDEEH